MPRARYFITIIGRARLPMGVLAAWLSLSWFLPGPLQAQQVKLAPKLIPASSFLSAPAQGDPLDIALRFARTEFPGKKATVRGARGFTLADFQNLRVRDRLSSRHNGVTHLHFQQVINGLEVYEGDLQAHVAPDGSLVAMHNRLVSTSAATAVGTVPTLSAAECVRRAALALGLTPPDAPADTLGGANPTLAVFSERSVSLDAIPAKLVYFPQESGALRLAWNLIVRTPDRQHWLDMNVDAVSGAILSQAEWMHDAACYRVSALPLVGPGEGTRELVSGVEDATASPFGWHDTNGLAGAEFTDTRGNNVDAITDPDGLDSGNGFRPDGGSTLTFDFPVDFTQAPSTNQSASVTSLFYAVNVCHDIFYRHGFDEAAGNFQTNNYGRGGLGSDAVVAEAQDAALPGNAQFGTPPDGTAPLMEMGLGDPSLVVTAPASIAGVFSARRGAFGPVTGFSGTVVQGTDDAVNGTSTTDCCGSLTNGSSVSGKIALIDRGSCNFTVKVKNAQLAGAIGVIMVNNAGNSLVTMSGTDATITIPSVFIGQSDGQTIKNALEQGVQVSFAATNTDTAMDATITVHEFGHGVTNRLTGGPSNASALSGTIPGGLGEGWSDFFALALTAKPTETRTTQRIVALSLDPRGIRSKPYSSDLAANPLTYDNVRTRTEVHALGEIWANMLWEVYWNLVEGYGFDPNLYTGTGGNNLALQLVIDGCKLQPANPNYIQARDAILQADLVNNGGRNQFALWQGFARRGLGFSATAGVNTSDNQITAAFDVPAAQDQAQPFNDGVPNLVKAAFHMNLVAPGQQSLPQPTTAVVGADSFRAIQFKQLHGGVGTAGIDYHINGIHYVVEVSNDLITWSSGSSVVAVVSVNPDSDGVTDTVVVRSLQAQPFFRLRLTRTSSS